MRMKSIIFTLVLVPLVIGVSAVSIGGSAQGPSPVLYFFYPIHVHVPRDFELPSRAGYEGIIAVVQTITNVLERHGAKGTFLVVYQNAKAALDYQGAKNMWKQLEERGHEVGVHSHQRSQVAPARETLRAAGVQRLTTVTAKVNMPPAEALKFFAELGFTVHASNWSPTDEKTGLRCSDPGQVGNTMYRETQNLMHPWRPDYINGDVCRHNPGAKLVNVDHVGPGWMNLDGTHADPLTQAHFARLQPWFEAALRNVDEHKINAWGFVTHQFEYVPGGYGAVAQESLAALDNFLGYVDQYVAQGKVQYATAREIAERFASKE